MEGDWTEEVDGCMELWRSRFCEVSEDGWHGGCGDEV